MAGTSAPNKPVFYRSAAVIQARATQLGKNVEQFTNGCNRGVANGAIGVNTGEFNPKPSDFNRVLRYGVSASYIGQRDAAVAASEDRLWGLPDAGNQLTTALQVGFNTAAGATAPAATYGTTIVCTNHTGLTMPAGSWAWGLVSSATPVAPVISAGGPYTFTVLDEKPNYTVVQLAGTLTAGTDPNPVIYWDVLSGVPNPALVVWTNRSALNATFKMPGYNLTTGAIVQIVMTVTPNDGPGVISIATLTYVGP